MVGAGRVRAAAEEGREGCESSATTTPPQLSSAPEPALGRKIVRFRLISYWLLLFAALKMAAAEAGRFFS